MSAWAATAISPIISAAAACSPRRARRLLFSRSLRSVAARLLSALSLIISGSALVHEGSAKPAILWALRRIRDCVRSAAERQGRGRGERADADQKETLRARLPSRAHVETWQFACESGDDRQDRPAESRQGRRSGGDRRAT